MRPLFNFQDLRNGEAVEFIHLFLDRTDPGNATVPPSYTRMRELLSSLSTDLTALNAADRFTELTEIIRLRDRDRDRRLVDLFAMVKACTSHPEDGAIAAAAITVDQKLTGHGSAADIAKDNFISETTTVDKLLTELRGPLAAQVALMPIGPWVRGLAASNEAVRAAYLERGDNEAESLPFTMKQKRQEARTAFLTILRKIELFDEEFAGAAPWQEIKSRTQVLLEDFRNRLARREGVAQSNATPAQA